MLQSAASLYYPRDRMSAGGNDVQPVHCSGILLSLLLQELGA